MSRWWPERVVLRLGDPPRAGGLGQSGSPSEPDRPAARSEEVWSAFEHQVASLALSRGTRVTCVVAGECVRYAVVPWHDELGSDAQRQILAGQCFRDTYGDSAASWAVRQGSGHYGAATLACALDTVLLDRLDAWSASRGFKLVSVQPSLMHAWNRARRRIAAGPFWFVLVEHGWTIVLLMSADDEPLHVKRWPSPVVDLARRLDREWLSIGTDLPYCPVYLDHVGALLGAAPTSDRAAAKWQFIDLTPASSEARTVRT